MQLVLYDWILYLIIYLLSAVCVCDIFIIVYFKLQFAKF